MTNSSDRNRTVPGLREADEARILKRRTATDDSQIREFTIQTALLLDDRHCEQVIVFDVRGLSDITDYIVIATGTSDRQILAVGQEVENTVGPTGIARFGREVDNPAKWLVLDFVDVVVHLFTPATRAHYDLEMFWGDAPQIDWHSVRQPPQSSDP